MTTALKVSEIRKRFADGKWRKLPDMAHTLNRTASVEPHAAVRALSKLKVGPKLAATDNRVLYGTAVVLATALKKMVAGGTAEVRGGRPVAFGRDKEFVPPAVYRVHERKKAQRPPVCRGGRRAKMGFTPGELYVALAGRPSFGMKDAVEWVLPRMDADGVRDMVASSVSDPLRIAAMSKEALAAWAANYSVRTLVKSGRLTEAVSWVPVRSNKLSMAGRPDVESTPGAGRGDSQCASETIQSSSREPTSGSPSGSSSVPPTAGAPSNSSPTVASGATSS